MEARVPPADATGARATFRGLFPHLAEEAQVALVPFLDARAVQQLLVFENRTPRLLSRLRLRLPASRLRVLVAVWARRGPDAVRDLLAQDPHCPSALLRGALADLPEQGERWLDAALKDGRLALEDLVEYAAPARAALACLWRYAGDRSQAATWRPALRRARALTWEHLGAEVAAWSEALRRVPTFDGGLPELLSTVGRAVSR